MPDRLAATSPSSSPWRPARAHRGRGVLGRRRVRGQGRGAAGGAPGRGELQLRPPRRRRRAFAPGGGLAVVLTVTTPEEAARASVAPGRAVPAGAEAGAHRGSLANDDRPDQDRPVRALLAAVRRHTLVPLVAAGGVGGPDDVADLMAGVRTWSRPGLRSCAAPRAARRRPSRMHSPRRASTRPRAPAPSAAGGPGPWSTPCCGPPRRTGGLSRDQQRDPPAPRRGGAPGDPQHMSLYAGTAFRQAEARPAAEVVERLVSGLRR